MNISELTKEGLRKKRATGWKPKDISPEVQKMGHAANKAKADAYMKKVMPSIKKYQAEGIKSLSGIAQRLTHDGVITDRGNTQWYAQTVKRILVRDGCLKKRNPRVINKKT